MKADPYEKIKSQRPIVQEKKTLPGGVEDVRNVLLKKKKRK